MHPHQSTIDLLKTLTGHLPPRFSAELGRCMRQRVEVLEKDENATLEQIEDVAVELGKYTWHFRRAWEEAYARDGKAIEEERLFDEIPEELGQRIREDVEAEKHNAHDIIRLSAFETNYTPEEHLVIEEALLRSRQTASEELIRRLHDNAIPDYEKIVLKWKETRLKIEAALLELRNIARMKPKWADEIRDVVHQYEIGFTGVMGREPTLDEVRGRVAEYQGRS